MTAPPLTEALANRQWIRRILPFPHVVATRVFVQDFYCQLEDAFRAVIARGLSEQPSGSRLSRNIPGYDAYSLSLNGPGLEVFGVFQSWAWHGVLAGLFDLNATGHVNAGLHRHRPGSADGWVHNDLNPGWFADTENRDGVVVARHDLCSYTRGTPASPQVHVVQTVRAVAMVYYLANGPWPEDEGGTGLYKTWDQPVQEPDVVVRPVDNSILIFECTPFSFHSFIGGNVRPRNSVIMWLHRPRTDIVARWGESAIRDWAA
jgi:2OG-Fe(II) oxygenase superfamily